MLEKPHASFIQAPNLGLRVLGQHARCVQTHSDSFLKAAQQLSMWLLMNEDYFAPQMSREWRHSRSQREWIPTWWRSERLIHTPHKRNSNLPTCLQNKICYYHQEGDKSGPFSHADFDTYLKKDFKKHPFEQRVVNKINRPGARCWERKDVLKASAVWLMERLKVHISSEKSPGHPGEIQLMTSLMRLVPFIIFVIITCHYLWAEQRGRTRLWCTGGSARANVGFTRAH